MSGYVYEHQPVGASCRGALHKAIIFPGLVACRVDRMRGRRGSISHYHCTTGYLYRDGQWCWVWPYAGWPIRLNFSPQSHPTLEAHPTFLWGEWTVRRLWRVRLDATLATIANHGLRGTWVERALPRRVFWWLERRRLAHMHAAIQDREATSEWDTETGGKYATILWERTR